MITIIAYVERNCQTYGARVERSLPSEPYQVPQQEVKNYKEYTSLDAMLARIAFDFAKAERLDAERRSQYLTGDGATP
jgi:hypothetical protein